METKKLKGFAWMKVNKPKKFKRIQSELGKRGREVQRKNKIGFFEPSHRIQKIGGKVSSKICKEKSIGIFDNEIRNKAIKKSIAINRKYGTGLFDKKIKSMGGKMTHKKHPYLAYRIGKIGGNRTKELHPNQFKEMGKKSYESIYKNSPYIWKGVNFMSNEEMECAKILLDKPIDGVNCNIRIGSKTIDFFPQSYDKMFKGSFVEYHPYDFDGLTNEEYIKKREEVIKNSNYKGKELVVIDNQNFIKENCTNYFQNKINIGG